MAQSPSPESRPRVTSRCQRLFITQTVLYCLLAITGAVYLFVTLFSVPGFWLPVTRLMLSVALVALAFVENALRCEGREIPAAHPASDIMTEKAPLSHRLLPANVQAWLHHFHQHLATTAITASLAIAFAIANLADSQPVDETDASQPIAVAFFILLCFMLLLIERMLSFRTIRDWPHQQHHVGFARFMLSLFLLLTVSLLAAMAFPTPALWGIKLASLMLCLVALEYLLRTLSAMASPLPAHSAPRFLTRSLFAALYQWPPRPLVRILASFQQRFGVDLRRIQAFRLIGNRLVPVAGGIAVLGWLLSGLTEIQLHQRGIYERFGRPTSVLAPGLHVGLPWPFGRVVAIENGAVHELQLSDVTETTQPDPRPDAAEGPAPQSSWRLWDSSHATDQSQVIASAAMDSQNFQIVNMDIRLIWRIGPGDRDALNSQYHTDDLPGLIRSIARQILVTQFASKQLDELLDEQRATLAATLSQQIQQRLTALNTGVELLFTRIEAIHPPAGAANAYHGVQAAQIAANALIAREQGYAARVNSEAQRNALTGLNNAEASGAESLAQARAAAATFSAEQQAWQQAGEAFMTERRYQILSQTLAHTPLLILDSHLQGTSEPVLDLRQYSALSDSTAPQKASTP